MPLVVISGIPCSGKTYFANRLAAALTKQGKECIIVSETNQYPKDVLFSDTRLEKDLRGFIKSEVQRLLTSDLVVIVDSKNYIKGYRYELYCISKSVGSTQVTVHCDILPEDAWKRNLQLPLSDQYSKSVFDALVFRYEAPDSRNRWDSPLFTARSGEEPPVDDVIISLYGRKPPPPNQSTQSQPLSATNFLYELDQATQKVVSHILEMQKVVGQGSKIQVPGSNETFTFARMYTTAELSRLKRQFISYTKSHPLQDASKIPTLFLSYLKQTLA
ncbi:protein KTI12 homolog [Artemia franciscana]|uniref:Protein KTI12 homolog n=1 Tax=Artemia franciscana TaxID=6661 RepID=A0AA88IAG1_ARTSF|nr:hypothetical protein QYM36_000189 [Artemia franciscana]KAK2725604.1 hypothetical protein QYM36_000189 [Artemia franciscana]